MGNRYFRNGSSWPQRKRLLHYLTETTKKNETIFCRLNRWIGRIIPLDFVIEHIPAAKNGIADNLSRHPVREAQRLSRYDKNFKVAKLLSINLPLVYTFVESNNRLISVSSNQVAVCKYKHQFPPDEGWYACGETIANQNACILQIEGFKLEKLRPWIPLQRNSIIFWLDIQRSCQAARIYQR